MDAAEVVMRHEQGGGGTVISQRLAVTSHMCQSPDCVGASVNLTEHDPKVCSDSSPSKRSARAVVARVLGCAWPALCKAWRRSVRLELARGARAARFPNRGNEA